LHEKPCASSFAISSTSTDGSTTTPLPMTGVAAFVHDAGRHQVQRQLLVAMDNRVACIVASLVAHDIIVVTGDEVRDLALALVAPLGADENGARHLESFHCAGIRVHPPESDRGTQPRHAAALFRATPL
jgi:hypothetical protein